MSPCNFNTLGLIGQKERPHSGVFGRLVSGTRVDCIGTGSHDFSTFEGGRRMSSQQFLLLILVIVIIGAAIAAAVFLFHDQSAASNRDGLSSDLLKLSVRVYQYYVRPKAWGGGEKSFAGLSMEYLTSNPRNANGTYSVVSVSPSEVVLRGVGITRGTDGNLIAATMVVFPDSTYLSFAN